MTPEQTQRLLDAGYSIEKIRAYERARGLTPPTISQNNDPLKTAATALNTVFGGEKIGEAIGTQIAKMRATPEERQFIEGPSGKEVAGDVLRTGALFTPIGKIAGLAARGASALGIGSKAAQVAGNVTGGATAGALADVGVSLAEGQQPSLGLGTALGAGIPGASPVANALARRAAKATGKVASELGGALTGTSAEPLQHEFWAARAGGDEAKRFTDALRGKTTPEKLVNTLRENIDIISTERQQLFRNTLKELADIPLSTEPAKTQFANDLTNAGVLIDEKGMLDFTNSKLRTVPNAQTKLQQAWAEISSMPETMSLADLDTTRQAIKGIKSISGNEPSANLANKLIDDAVRAARTAGEQVDGYGKMLDNFAESSEFLDELQRGLSTGDQATVDQTYRRMATTLKTNNEQRMALLNELDQLTGGSILSEVSGQQLSETLPRGIFRQISAGIAGGAIVTGGLSTSMIPALVFASPRVTGEFIRALGLTASKADQMIEAVETARNLLIKGGAIGGAVKESSNLEQ